MTSREQPSNSNISALDTIKGFDPQFYICWRRQSCSECLAGDVDCSWCAISSTCVPSGSRVPILAPIISDQICPLGSKERWELRAAPFGCNVSTTTVLSTTVAITGTISLLCIGLLVFWLARRLRSRLKQTEYERLDSESEERSWRRWLGLDTILSLARRTRQGRTQGQESIQTTEEAQEEGETRPLLQ
ncbi:hypothetical protein N7456_007758 [Penicillium angulare]|uniref:PSI domain-containing protein n=1 Tax=Penicillium angulare TaxID=116970 RepID=A0A9W9K9K5_9EURO|nr:hypothetical protein N7456_007758 [Penicillium angulare]